MDKKGILSWPNPAPEKVFFLTNADDASQNSRYLLQNTYKVTAKKYEAKWFVV